MDISNETHVSVVLGPKGLVADMSHLQASFVHSSTHAQALELALPDDKPWMLRSGGLTLMSLAIEGKTYVLGKQGGVQVAYVVNVPVVEANQPEKLYMTSSHFFTLKGSGFTYRMQGKGSVGLKGLV